MCHNFAKRVTVFACLLLPVAASAQRSNKENAAYSRYGIGETAYGTNAMLRGLGYSSSAYADGYSINADNPASYSWLHGATYELGMMASTRGIQTVNQSYNTGSASLAYLAVGLPLRTKYKSALSFGLRPQSKVFYHNVDSSTNPQLGKIANEYSGDGGLNYAYVGASMQYKGFSLGANLGYMFGTIQNTSRLVYIDTANVVSSEFTRYTQIGGLYYKLGAQYETKLNKKLRLRLGATATLNQQLNADRESYALALRIKSGTSTTTDTAYQLPTQAGRITLPLSYSFGAQIGGDKWNAMLDYTNTAWGQYRSFGVSDSMVDNASRISGGVEFTPNADAFRNYLKRVTYRVGFYYGTDAVMLRNNEINYYGITAGASFPFRRGIETKDNKIHLAFEYGQKGTLNNNLIKENFFKFTAGISLSAIGRNAWFKKTVNY